jgi:hypothetical protein
VTKIQYKNGIKADNNQTNYKVSSGSSLDLNFFGEELFLFVISGEVSWAEPSVNQYAICNAGSYDIYPSLLLNAQDFSIKKNNKEIYNYSMKIPVVASIDGQNGFVLSQGQPIENVSYRMKQNETVYEYVLVDSWTNNGSLEIESGKPQILKARFTDGSTIWYDKKPSNEEKKFYLEPNEELVLTNETNYTGIMLKDGNGVVVTNYLANGKFKTEEPGEYVLKFSNSEGETIIDCTITVKNYVNIIIGYTYTFISPEPLQYDHRNRAAVHVFQNVLGMQPYNISTYPLLISEGNENTYNIQFINSHFATECHIECVKENDYYKYSILVPGADSYNLTEGLTYYISVCDYDILDIQVSGSSQDSFIYLQTRDAF